MLKISQDKKIPFKITLFLGVVFLFFFIFTTDTFAANRYWVGGAGAIVATTTSWSSTAGGASGASIPGASDIAYFTSNVVTDASIGATWSVAGINIASGYSGIITQAEGTTVTVGTSNYSQAGGTYTATTGTFDNNGTFSLSAGTFTPPTTSNTYAGNFTISGTGNYNIGATATTTIDGTGSPTVNVNGSLGGIVVITKSSGGSLTIASSTIINLGSNNITALYATGANVATLTNNGTINIPSGSWTFRNSYNGFGGTVQLVNNGLVVHGGDAWTFTGVTNTVGSGFTNNGSIIYQGSTLSFYGDFTQNGIFDLTGKTVTFNGAANATLTTASPNFNGSIILNKTAANTLTLANNLTVQDFTLTTGTLANVTKTLTINGNLVVTPAAQTYFGAGGSSLSVVMASSSDQNITFTSGSVTVPLTINKSAGKVSLLTNYTGSGAGGTINVATGTLYLNGKNVSATTTVSSGAELQIQGAETFTIPTLATGSTVTYVGDGDGVADAYVLHNLPFYNLKINATDANDVFQPAVFESGLIAYWRADGNALDSSGNNYNGVLFNSVATTTGRFNEALRFTANNQKVEINDADAFSFTSGGQDSAFSLSAWCYFNSLTYNMIVTKDAVTSREWIFYLNNGKPNITLGQGGGMSTTIQRQINANQETGQWIHYVVTYDGSETRAGLKIYKNGVQSDNLDGGSATYTGMSNTVAKVAIGSRTYGDYSINGNLDETRIYNRVLSQEEINSLYSNNYAISSTTPLSLLGDLTVLSGVFDSYILDLILTGTDQTITLATTTTISSLTKIMSTAGDLIFNNTDSSPLIVTSTTTLQGSEGNILNLKSVSADTPWYFSPVGTRDFSYLNVSDSHNVGEEINTSGMTSISDGGNNVGWTFGAAATLSVSKSGRQVATTTATSTDQDLGGAFTFLSTGGAMTVDSIKLKHVGSFPDSDIENIKIYYKEEGTCSAIKPDGATLFDTVSVLDENGQATSTGDTPISLTAGSTTCLYFVYDLTGTAGTSTMGRTIDFEITNPSTDIVVTGGTVNTTNKVNISGQTMIINSDILSLLSLKMADEEKNPTLFYLQNGIVWKKVKDNEPYRLTNPNLQVHELKFTDTQNGFVRMEITISNMDPGLEGTFMNVTRTLKTTAGVRVWNGD